MIQSSLKYYGMLDWIVNIKDEGISKKKSKEELSKFFEKILKTKTGKQIAKEKYL